MATDHDNDTDDGPAKSRWLAPGVLDRARRLTEGIRTSVDKPSPPATPDPPERERDRAAESEWAPASPDTSREQPADEPPDTAELAPDVPAWHPPSTRQPAPVRPTPVRPDPPRPPARPQTPLTRRLRNLTLRSQVQAPITGRWIAGAVVGIAAAGVVGLLVGQSRSDPEPQRISTPEFAITLPGDWERRPSGGDTSPLALGGTVVAGSGDQPDAGIAVGTLPASAAPGSAGLARPLDPTPPRADLVRLGRLPAYRYEGLRRSGSDRVATLFVIPRRSDSLAIACFAPPKAPRALLESCAATATTVVPAGVAGATRDGLERYLDRVGAVINRLGARRGKGRRTLARAQTPNDQAFAAKALDGDYRRAAARLGRIRGGGAAVATVRRLIRDLRATARAYRRLAVAAAQGAPGTFDAARRAVRRGEASVARRLATL